MIWSSNTDSKAPTIEDILRAAELVKPIGEKIKAIDAELARAGLRANLDGSVTILPGLPVGGVPMTLWQQIVAFFTPPAMTAAQADAQIKRWWGDDAWAAIDSRDGLCRLGIRSDVFTSGPSFEAVFASARQFRTGPGWRPKDQERG